MPSFATTAHRAQGNSYLGVLVYRIIKAVVTDTDEQSDEEVEGTAGGRSARFPSAGSSLPGEVGGCHPPGT